MVAKPLFQYAVLTVIWCWLMVFALIPNLLVLFVSVMTRSQDEFFELAFTMDGYLRLFDPLYLQVLLDSLYLAGLTTLFCLFLGYPFAYLISLTSQRVQALLLLLVIIPFWTSSLIRVYALVILLGQRGIVNSSLMGLGITDEPLEILYTPTATFIGLVYTLLPFMILPLYATLEKFNHRFIEAARDLGASYWQTFWHVVIPLTLPGIIAGSTLVFLSALCMFFIPDILGGAKSLLLGNLIRDQFLSARDWPFGAAASVLTVVLLGVLLWIYHLSASRVNQDKVLP